MTSQSHKVGVIGSGYWGRNLIRNFAELGALAAICDRDTATLESFNNQYDCACDSDIDAILSNPEIAGVAIATPAETHAELVRAAIEAGKDVFVEKPLCLDVTVGQQLVDLAAQRKRILMVGHLLWYHPAITTLKKLIDDGELGRIQYIYSNRLNLGKIRREENILWSFAPHDISVILGLLDEMPTTVCSQGGNYLHPKIADVTVSLLAFPSGVKAHLFVSWLHPFKEQKLVVVGDRKMAVFDDVEKEDKLLLYPHSIDWKNQVPVPNKADAHHVPLPLHEPLRAECQHFLDCIETREQPRTDGAEGVRVLTVLQKCQHALENEQPAGRNAATANAADDESLYTAHSSAFIDEDVVIGDGTTIWHVSHVMPGSRIGANCRIGQNVVIGPRVSIGDRCKIQNNVSVYEGVTLEDGVFCGPSMVFTNVINPRSDVPRMDELRQTRVCEGATLGANCTIVCGVTIGRYAFVAAGATVTRDVPNYALVMGTPAQVRGWVCQCGLKLNWIDHRSRCECGRHYQRDADDIQRATELETP